MAYCDLGAYKGKLAQHFYATNQTDTKLYLNLLLLLPDVITQQ